MTNSSIIIGCNSFSGEKLAYFLKKKGIKTLGTYRRKKSKVKIKQFKLDFTKDINLKSNVKNIILISAIHKVEEFCSNEKKNYEKNLLITKNVIKFAKINNIKNIIFFSTIDINLSKWPSNKKKYILSKKKSEEIFINEYKKGNFNKIILLRLPAIIGKHSNNNFLKSLVQSLKQNKKIFLWNQNDVYNNFIHLDDLCSLIYFLIKSKNIKKKILECKSSGNSKLIELVYHAHKKTNSKSKILLKNTIRLKKIKYYRKINGFKFKNNFSTFKKYLNELMF